MIVDPAPPKMVRGLSPTSMALWHQCRRRFYFERILRLDSGPIGEPGVRGWFVHLVLERLMRLDPDERTVDNARLLAATAWPEFVVDPQWRYAELGFDVTTDVVFKRRAWEGIVGYFRLEEPSEIDVAAVEVQLDVEVGGVPLRGVIDRVDNLGPRRLGIVDYKAGRLPFWRQDWVKKRAQVVTYAAMLAAVGQWAQTVRLLFVSPHLNPRTPQAAPAAIEWDVGVSDVDDARREAEGVWAGVVDAYVRDDWPGTVSKLCGWCPYAARCPDFSTAGIP